MAGGERPRTIWLDSGDFLRYFRGCPTPTGIGRVQAELFRWMSARHGGRVRFCRVNRLTGRAEAVPAAIVLSAADTGGFLHRFGGRRGFKLRQGGRWARRVWDETRAVRRANGAASFEAAVRPGDVLASFGASWDHDGFGEALARLKARHGLRVAIMVHDVLPISHPRFVNAAWRPVFERWLRGVVRVADVVFVPSQSSREALAAYLSRQDLPLPALRAVRFGAGLGDGQTPAPLPLAERRHALFVSTIEIRKNHLLAHDSWERLIAAHGAARVPDLVLVGKWGWDVEPFRAALARTNHLGGKLRVAGSVSDAELAALYARARFTLFPSFCEGWGLPVTESLAAGRYCIASNATSVPEAGGPFCDYHDPADNEAAYRLAERAVLDDAFLSRREASIARDYRPPGWREAADGIVAILDETATARTA